jgi:outer membrane receptor protein involved in Fe transport
MPTRFPSIRLPPTLLVTLLFVWVSPAVAQDVTSGAVVTGRVVDSATDAVIRGALIEIEGTNLRAISDAQGVYRVAGVPPGPQVLRARLIGYAETRSPVNVPPSGVVTQDLRMGVTALEMAGIVVTADPLGRARGELGTATVIGAEAIRAQTAASLAGILELVPGVPLQPPGLDGIQQIQLRSAVMASGGTADGGQGGDLSSFGTLIVLDGVAISNNANLQSLGPRGELPIPSTAGGGIDLRRIPASTIERVEVLSGVPSTRYGDLTHGAIIVDTRAGAVDPEFLFRFDARTVEATLLGGWEFRGTQAATSGVNFARTRLSPLNDDVSSRFSAQLAHRMGLGAATETGNRLTLDTRLDVFSLVADSPEQPEVAPGRLMRVSDSGIRLAHRARLDQGGENRLELTASVDRGRQSTFRQNFRIRNAMPFTDRLTEGRSVGFYVGGQYIARADIEGEPWQLYGRLEQTFDGSWFGFDHTLRAGMELRREWNSGAGYQFDVTLPPQVSFNAVGGFDRPRRFDAVPAVATAAFYLDERLSHVFGGSAVLSLQAGVRLDMMHDGTHWFSGTRDAVLQPRLTAEFAPVSWLRLRAGAGRTAKQPALGQLFPAPQYHDVVNVNWYADNPPERYAVLTTIVLDPTNPDLGYTIADKAELSLAVALGPASAITVTAFRDQLTGSVALDRRSGSFLREHYQLNDSTFGTGRPPELIEPASSADTIPYLLDRYGNVVDLLTRGIELTAWLPEIEPIRTRFELQGAWIENYLDRHAVRHHHRFTDFQLETHQTRRPFWEGASSAGDRAMLNVRAIHQQPAVGLVIMGTIQHVLREGRRDIAPTDSLAFAGYITRDGTLVHVPPSERARPEYADLREAPVNLLTERRETPSDWLFSLQVSKTLPLDGRLAFYAFNAFDRRGHIGIPGVIPRSHPATRFGLEVTMPLGSLVPGR